jgi:hypothetical protein
MRPALHVSLTENSHILVLVRVPEGVEFKKNYSQLERLYNASS